MTTPERIHRWTLPNGDWLEATRIGSRFESLTWNIVGDDPDIDRVDPRAVPLALVQALGRAYVDLVVALAPFGIAVAPDVPHDLEQQTERMRRHDAEDDWR